LSVGLHVAPKTCAAGDLGASVLPGRPDRTLARRSEDAACGSAGPELIRAGSTLEAMGGNVAELSAMLRAPGLKIYRRRRTFTFPEKAPARTRTR
jgi:hypothetical protein